MSDAPRKRNQLALQIGCMAAAAMAAVLARWWGGYPNCPTDELNWSHIATQLDQGVDWPVSGPLHVTLLRLLAASLSISYEQALAVKGVLFVPLAMAILLWCWRRLEVKPLRWALLALCLSSYFWAAWIESRPQQLGQMLVLLGGTSLWLALSGRGSWWLYAAVMLLTAFTHILSYALLLMLSVWVMAYFFLLRECPLSTIGRWSGSVGLSALVFVVPGGPYQAMLGDIGTNHLRGPGASIAAFVLMLLGLLATVLAARDRIRTQVLPAFERALQRARARPRAFGLVAGGVVLAALALQASILPAAAWAPYGGSVGRFLISQSGNLALAALMLAGWIDVITRPHALPALRAAAVMSLGWAGIGGALLLASLFLLDTNWLLRVLNYAILFAAPLAGLPLAALLRRWPLLWLPVAAMVAVSFVLAVRHLAIYSC